MKNQIDCENCGKRAAPVDGKCGACKAELGFLSKPRKRWEPWDYSGWLFAQHYILDEVACKKGLDALTENQRLVVVLGALYYQVMNGGLGQYYSNPTGDHAVEAAAALKFIGAEKLALAMESANGLFPGGAPSAANDVRDAQLDEIAEGAFDRCAARVSKLLDAVTKGNWLSLLVDRLGEKPVIDETRARDDNESPRWLSSKTRARAKSTDDARPAKRRASSSSEPRRASGSASSGSGVERASPWPRSRDYDAWLVATGEVAAQPGVGEHICYCHFAIQALAERQRPLAATGLIQRLLSAAGRNQERLFDGHEVAVSALMMLGDEPAASAHLTAMETIAARDRTRSTRAWLTGRVKETAVVHGLAVGARPVKLKPDEVVSHQSFLARRALARRDPELAITSLRTIEAMSKGLESANWHMLHDQYLSAGDLDGARRALRKLPAGDRELYFIPDLLAAGLREEAVKILKHQAEPTLKELVSPGSNPAGVYSDAADLIVQTLAVHGLAAAKELLRRVDKLATASAEDWGFSTAAAQASLSRAHVAVGDTTGAEALLRAAYETVAKKASDREIVLPTIAEEHARQGRVDEALTVIEKLRSSARRLESRCDILCLGGRWGALRAELAAIDKPARAASIGWAVCLHLGAKEDQQRAGRRGS